MGLFVAVLRLCAEAGLLRVGVVALDGTNLHANAILHRPLTDSVQQPQLGVARTSRAVRRT